MSYVKELRRWVEDADIGRLVAKYRESQDKLWEAWGEWSDKREQAIGPLNRWGEDFDAQYAEFKKNNPEPTWPESGPSINDFYGFNNAEVFVLMHKGGKPKMKQLNGDRLSAVLDKDVIARAVNAAKRRKGRFKLPSGEMAILTVHIEE